jgi:tetratricopeptide (TPR) repeat protein
MARLIKPLILVAVLAGIALGLYLLSPRHAVSMTEARAAIARRDFADARRILDEHLARNPADNDARFLAARTARRSGDPAAGERHIDMYLKAGGDSEQGGLERGLQLVQAGDVSIAGGLYAFCTKHPEKPEVPFILEALAQGFLASSRPAEAVLCLDKWLESPLSPADRAQGLVWRGQALDRLDQTREAIEDYRQAIELAPGNRDARLQLATILSDSEPLPALEMFAQLDRETPGLPEVRLGMARCRRQLGEMDEAAALLSPLLVERRDNVAVVIEAAKLALDRGRPAEAEPLLRHAIELAATNRVAVAQLARCLKDLGKDAEADHMQAKLKQMNEDHERWLAEVKKKN